MDDSRPLNANQERFCQEYLTDLNEAAAYRRAYPDATPASADTAGPRMFGKVRVKERIKELLDTRAVRVGLTHDWVIGRLMEEATDRGEDASHSARVAALGLLGKHLGMFVDQVEVRADALLVIKRVVVERADDRTDGGHVSRSE